MHTNRGTFCAILLLGITIMMPMLYLGSYLVLADNAGRLEIRDDGRCYTRQYHYGGQVAETVYWPAHFFDVKLRPAHWGVYE